MIRNEKVNKWPEKSKITKLKSAKNEWRVGHEKRLIWIFSDETVRRVQIFEKNSNINFEFKFLFRLEFEFDIFLNKKINGFIDLILRNLQKIVKIQIWIQT